MASGLIDLALRAHLLVACRASDDLLADALDLLSGSLDLLLGRLLAECAHLLSLQLFFRLQAEVTIR